MLEKLLENIAKAMDANEIPYMVIGGQAVLIYGEPRLTKDIDITLYEIAWEVGFEMDRIISTIAATRDQLEHGPMGANPLMLKIVQEGVRV